MDCNRRTAKMLFSGYGDDVFEFGKGHRYAFNRLAWGIPAILRSSVSVSNWAAI